MTVRMFGKGKAGRGIKAVTLASIALLGLSACASGISDTNGVAEDGSEQYTFALATGAMAGTPHSAVEQRYLDMVEERTDGRISFDRQSFEALCKMDEVVKCLSDGRADIGTTVTDYTPNVLPTLGVVGIPFLNTDMQAATAALHDMHTQYEPAVATMEENNLQFVSTWPSSSMFIGSKHPVEKVEDLDGLRARTAGPVTQETLNDAGVNVNAITAAETYEALQRGVIDSVGVALDFAVQYKITEQLPYWTDPGLGQYTAYGMWWSKDAYDSLPEDLQSIVDEVTEELNYGEAMVAFNDAQRSVCDGMLESSDVESFTRWSEDATQAWYGEAGEDAETMWLDIVDGYGFEAAPEYLDEYKAAYASHESPDNPVEAGLSCVDEWQEQNN